VHVTVDFVFDDDGFKVPGSYGPLHLSAREWAAFDAQAAVEAQVIAIATVEETPPAEVPER
jgi:hypothetical protein